MGRHEALGAEGMLQSGTDIDLIDPQRPQSVAYFSWVHLDRRDAEILGGRADNTTNHACRAARLNMPTRGVSMHTP